VSRDCNILTRPHFQAKFKVAGELFGVLPWKGTEGRDGQKLGSNYAYRRECFAHHINTVFFICSIITVSTIPPKERGEALPAFPIKCLRVEIIEKG